MFEQKPEKFKKEGQTLLTDIEEKYVVNNLNKKLTLLKKPRLSKKNNKNKITSRPS